MALTYEALATQVGPMRRSCGWPLCRGSHPRGLLVEAPGEDWVRGRLPVYCSETCRLAAQKRRRTLHEALRTIDLALRDSRLARQKQGSEKVLTKKALRQWRARVLWELDGLDVAKSPADQAVGPQPGGASEDA